MTSAHRAEHRKAASQAGLRYVTDGVRGITRQRAGTGWSYHLPNGKRVVASNVRKRLNKLAIPPAWTDVWICPDPDGHIQATARDARGRKQYRYHASYREARDQSKFRRMLEFSEVLPALRERIERDLRAPDLSRRQLLATVVRLLDRTLIRVGNDEYARENRSFGLTTLRRRHVKVDGTMLRFSFRGKSGVEHTIAIADPRLASIIQRCRTCRGRSCSSTSTTTASASAISSDDVNAYLRELTGRDITAKDFRTWGGTMLAAVELRADGRGREPPRGRPQHHRARSTRWPSAWATRARYAASTTCTRRCCRPTCWATPCRTRRRSRAGARRKQPGAALRRDEVLVLQFLQERV